MQALIRILILPRAPKNVTFSLLEPIKNLNFFDKRELAKHVIVFASHKFLHPCEVACEVGHVIMRNEPKTSQAYVVFPFVLAALYAQQPTVSILVYLFLLKKKTVTVARIPLLSSLCFSSKEKDCNGREDTLAIQFLCFF